MIIRGLYEIAVPVKELSRAEDFYRSVLGFEVGLRDQKRPWVFMRIGAAAMIVLQATGAEPTPMHFAFTVSPSDLDQAAGALNQRGIASSDRSRTTGSRRDPRTSAIRMGTTSS